MLYLLNDTCLLCGSSHQVHEDLCAACLANLPRLAHSCYRCARSLPKIAPLSLCGQCLQDPPSFDRTYALFAYEFPINHWLISFKFQQKLWCGRILGILLGQYLRTVYHNQPLPTRIIPVPLHPQRLKTRGYNQAVELAKSLAKQLKIPLDYDSCTRIRATATQTLLPADQRTSNVAKAFRCHSSLHGQHVAVVDDVMTTGATVNALCKTLRQQGVRQIDVWCCARTL